MKKENFDFRTIKSFDDACKKEGIDPNALPDVSMIPEPLRKALIGCYKLFIIFQAINNGWLADFTKSNQVKYFPWLRVNSAGSGFDFALSSCGYGYTYASVGSRLCAESREKALYIGEQFGAEYAEFFL